MAKQWGRPLTNMPTQSTTKGEEGGGKGRQTENDMQRDIDERMRSHKDENKMQEIGANFRLIKNAKIARDV